MDGRAKEEIPAITHSGNAGMEVSEYKFSNAGRTKFQKFCTVWKSKRICNTKTAAEKIKK
jgi:hypothetical protein